MASADAYLPGAGPERVMETLEFKATKQMVHVAGEKSTKEDTMKTNSVILVPALLLMIAVLQSGCEQVSLVGRPTVGPGPGVKDIELVANVEGLDTRHQEIYLRTDEGRDSVVTYHRDTRVLIDGREYPVRELRTGDRVAMQIREGPRGQDYTDLIRVRDRDRSVASEGTTAIVEGTVERVNGPRGIFELRPRFGAPLRVVLPYNPPRQVEEEFYRIRAGDYVRVEGNMVAEDRLILRAFL